MVRMIIVGVMVCMTALVEANAWAQNILDVHEISTNPGVHAEGYAHVPCVPAAAANVLGYWAKKGYTAFFPSSHDPANPDAKDVNALLKTLIDEMRTRPGDGTTDHISARAGLRSTLLKFCASTGAWPAWPVKIYGFGSEFWLGWNRPAFDRIKSEIDAGRPCIAMGSPFEALGTGSIYDTHAVTVIGYVEEADFRALIVLDGWKGNDSGIELANYQRMVEWNEDRRVHNRDQGAPVRLLTINLEGFDCAHAGDGHDLIPDLSAYTCGYLQASFVSYCSPGLTDPAKYTPMSYTIGGPDGFGKTCPPHGSGSYNAGAFTGTFQTMSFGLQRNDELNVFFTATARGDISIDHLSAKSLFTCIDKDKGCFGTHSENVEITASDIPCTEMRDASTGSHYLVCEIDGGNVAGHIDAYSTNGSYHFSDAEYTKSCASAYNEYTLIDNEFFHNRTPHIRVYLRPAGN